jgi:transposase InsO family protein
VALLEDTLKREGERRLNVSGVLRILGVSRSGYNSFREREFGMNARPSERKNKIKSLILDIHLWSKQIYGAPKITMELNKMGFKIAEKTVGNYMREMGLRAHYIKPYVKTTIDPDFDNHLKNLLNEQFNPEKPNAIWCSDITYIHTGKGFAYLTSIMELFSRRIVAWRLSDTLEAKWVVECVLEAKKQRRTTQPLVLHADRGSQYVSGTYMEALGNIMPSYSQKASPWQNACIESFHALIKREWLYRFNVRDFDHAHSLVFEYIEAFYNTVRSHSHCGYLSPQEYEEYYYAQLKRALGNIA